MAKQKVFFCTKCGCLKRHTYAGREKGAFLEEVVMGVVSLGWYQLINIAAGEKIGGTTYWECDTCKKIKEVS